MKYSITLSLGRLYYYHRRIRDRDVFAPSAKISIRVLQSEYSSGITMLLGFDIHVSSIPREPLSYLANAAFRRLI